MLEFNTLITLSSRYGVELGFFLRLQNHGPHPRVTGLGEVGPRILLLKPLTIGHDPASVLAKCGRSEGLQLTLNEVVSVGMEHRTLGWIA